MGAAMVRCRRGLALGASVAAIAAAVSSPATAACDPDPTIPRATTTCSGTDENGLRLGTPGTSVIVERTAAVAGGSGSAIVLEVPVGDDYPNSASIVIDGLVQGGADSGILALNGPLVTSFAFGPTLLLDVSVGEGGSVNGSNAIAVAQSSGNTNGRVLVSIDNAGVLSGTSGIALLAADPQAGGFDSIVNRPTGSIGAISGAIGALSNEGLIDGGALAAIDNVASTASFVTWAPWSNSGTITSSSAQATILNPTTISFYRLTNSGTISNTGSGAAVEGGQLYLTNEAGGTISSVSGAAINATTSLDLVNGGMILGYVIASQPLGTFFSATIDSSLGTIAGDVLLGDGDDVVVGRYAGGADLVTGVTGALNGGAGTNRLRLLAESDLVVNTPVNLPGTFQRLELAPDQGVTITLADGFVAPASPIALANTGSVVNATTIAAATQAFYIQYPSAYGDLVQFSNSGTIITTDPSFYYAVDLSGSSGARAFLNSGAISSAGGGVALFSTPDGAVNTGTIEAVRTAVSASNLVNSGTIRSTSEVGVDARQLQNTGLIEGATVAVTTSGEVVNGGIIRSAARGVRLQSYGVVNNLAEGEISGGVYAIDAGVGGNQRIFNAGTINGNVRLAASDSRTDSRFVVVDGGVLNGDLTLGAGAILVTDYPQGAPGTLRGINGTVVANGGSLRYRISQDTSATLGAAGPFSTAGYELSDGVALSLLAPATQTQTLVLAGDGSVDLTADFTVVNDYAIEISTPTLLPGEAEGQGLSIISRGDLVVTSSNTFAVAGGVALPREDTTFTNAGTITVVDTSSDAGTTAAAAAFDGAGHVVNLGTVNLDGAIGYKDYGFSNTSSFDNRGSLVQTGPGRSLGVYEVAVVSNSGVIDVGGAAISGGSRPRLITNSGQITSRNDNALYLGGTGARVDNLTGGVITAGPGFAAINMYFGNGVVSNAGTINGNVDLAGFWGYGGSTYIAAGGVLNGDLILGDGLFLQVGANTPGVTGSISGSGIYGFSLNESGTVALETAPLTNFADRLVHANGPDVVATIGNTEPFTGTVYALGSGTVRNEATIDGAVRALVPQAAAGAFAPADPPLMAFENQGTINGGFVGTALAFENRGTIRGGNAAAVMLTDVNPGGPIFGSGDPTYAVVNDGTIAAASPTSATGLWLEFTDTESLGGYAIQNNGMISAEAQNVASVGLRISGRYANQPADSITAAGTIVNSSSGVIAASGGFTTGIAIYDAALDLTNLGTVSGGSLAVSVLGTKAARIDNQGLFQGRVLLGAGDDWLRNAGTITGFIFLAQGNDHFVHVAGATNGGVVNGGEGFDTYEIETGGSMALDAASLLDFEHLLQTGSGSVTYAGAFGFDTVELQGGTLAVAAGTTVSTSGATTITGGDSGVVVENAGTVAGNIVLGGGADMVTNAGTIGGSVALGGGSDTFFAGPGSSVGGNLDGGEGSDLFRISLAGDRAGLGNVTGFEHLLAEGSGVLTLALQQDFESIALAGTGLSLATDGHAVGSLLGSAAAEAVSSDGDLAQVALGGGNDTLALGATTLAGIYDGGADTDQISLTSAGPVTIAGRVTGFETISLAGNALTLSGTLGTAGEFISFGSGSQSVTVTSGGVLGGSIDLGSGDDTLRLAGAATSPAALAGGEGKDQLVITTSGDTLFAPAAVQGFERLSTEGAGTLTFRSAASFDQVDIAGSLRVDAFASLTTPSLLFSAADNLLALDGNFTGSADGGAGTDRIVIGGGAGARNTFGSLAAFESLVATGGLSTLSGTASFNTMMVSGGSFFGLANSRLTVPTITVGQGGTFGSAGTVNGNLAVSGTLAPGASIGTMTVNGNVSLGATSTTVFELSPAQSDRLVVNGGVTIAQGATLTLTALQPVAPGFSLNLITATGGVTGSFTTVNRPQGMFGVLVNQGNTLSLLGQFANSASYAPGVQRNIDAFNALLASGSAGPAVLAAAPSFVAADGSANTALFAQLSPDSYAGGREVLVEAGLVLRDTARKGSFGTASAEPGPFTFATAFAGQRELEGDSPSPESDLSVAGVAGGVGFGSAAASASAFVGYLSTDRDGTGLASRAEADGLVIGINGRIGLGPVRGSATIAYLDAEEDLQRAAPLGTAGASAPMTGWLGDAAIAYAMPIGRNFELVPTLGITAIRVERDAIGETGSSPFLLSMEEEEDTATFADFSVELARSAASAARFVPSIEVGVRHQFGGRSNAVTGAIGGGSASLLGIGAVRAEWVAHASAGLSAELTDTLSLSGLVTGEAGEGERAISGSLGLALEF